MLVEEGNIPKEREDHYEVVQVRSEANAGATHERWSYRYRRCLRLSIVSLQMQMQMQRGAYVRWQTGSMVALSLTAETRCGDKGDAVAARARSPLGDGRRWDPRLTARGRSVMGWVGRRTRLAFC
jgi:hypothetical protein